MLAGEDRGPHADALVLGASLALELVGEVRSPLEGVELARSAIAVGAARRVLDGLQAFARARSER